MATSFGVLNSLELIMMVLRHSKENMKKINHPLTGFLMGDEGSSYAV